MDPNATLAILRQTIKDSLRLLDREPDTETEANALDLLDTMVEATDALDKWISKGGVLPSAWCNRAK